MQEQLRRFVIEQIRMGATPADIRKMLETILSEINTVESYLKAVKEADFRP
jgi:hypothetical protein